ncbi:putative flavin carrier protein precursor [Podospora australis]|uniref:Flavin carrier protein n=1 Tax=Podospora australis TaxID=1536484 RepID=A0AAN6WZR2_9PEZI|nr:putative flavin carrier protein precursor [Podospora australis]
MRLSIARPFAALTALAGLVAPVAAEPILQSNSLNSCQENSGFQASLFKVVFTPNNLTANIDIVAVSSVQGSVLFDVDVTAYGFSIIKQTIDPCKVGLPGLCPMTAGKIPLNFNIGLKQSDIEMIPGIAYTFPDLDAKVKVFFNMTDGPEQGRSVACVEADISNGKTVDLLGVKWATALVAFFALVSSAIMSGLGHYNAASHVAANALSLFGYFQAQAMIGLTGVPLPPIVMSWTQDFQWSMGIVRLDWMQDIFTWYQRATGGTAATIFDSIQTVSVQVEKRSLSVVEAGTGLVSRSAAMMPRSIVEPVADLTKRALLKRANIQTSSGSYIVYGIQRVAFRAGIETTNLFMTSLTFFCLMIIFVSASVAAFKYACELAVKQKWMASDKFLDFRNGWLTVLKGILFRLTLIGWPSMTILCLWEFTQNDSPALMVLAIFFLVGMAATLGWAAAKVIRIARRSILMHNNPAYILFSDPQALNKWGFLYVQFRASAYYFILPVLGYLLVKGMFIAFAQGKSTAQAVGFIIIEAAALIAASVLRPWMDKSTNSFNIAICAINFVNSIFLLIFTEVFNQPPIVTGVVGIVLWIANAIFALVLLLMLIATTVMVIFRENPDGRYQFMADDRTSFMKSQTHLTTTTELDALAVTARGGKEGFNKGLDLDDDAESITSDSLRRQTEHLGVPSAAASNNNFHNNGYNSRPRSPADPSMPFFPADGPRSPPRYNDKRAPSPFDGGAPQYGQQSPPGFNRAQNNASPSPWQRGAGYEH